MTLPGTPEHQRLLRAIASCYAEDPRVLAVAVFGSLARGTWDEHSDLDLVVILADGVTANPLDEVRRLCQAFGHEPVTVEPDGDDAADIVLPSLIELSVRLHPLHATTPFVVDNLLVLTGRLDAQTIEAAGRANRETRSADLMRHVQACIRQAITVDGALHRRRFWRAYQVLYLARLELLLMHARSHDLRPFHALDAEIDPALESRFRRTLPGGDLPSVQRALLGLLDLLEQDVPILSAGRAQLTGAQRDALAKLRLRQATLDLN
jgi:predicted nucleotidyltransferase